ncbi:hypothetical protein [Enterococcus gallinarum]|uniref:hypothetical protein n=1 Tax=Enterococcus gallinarum TaxID=1353 RepID=UPI003D6C5B0D
MIKLEEMGTILMHIALQYTHPDFESMYSDWSTVHDIGEKLVKMSDQPQLNPNQQIVLEWLKLQAPTAKPMQVIFWMMNNAAWGKLDELRKPIMHLTDKQQAQVLEEFGKWAQEQEEE